MIQLWGILSNGGTRMEGVGIATKSAAARPPIHFRTETSILIHFRFLPSKDVCLPRMTVSAIFCSQLPAGAAGPRIEPIDPHARE